MAKKDSSVCQKSNALTSLHSARQAEPDQVICSVGLSEVFVRRSSRTQLPTDQAAYSLVETHSCQQTNNNLYYET